MDKGRKMAEARKDREFEEQEEYQEGKKAFKSKSKLDSCPYEIGDNNRYKWMMGFLDTQTKKKYGKKYGDF